MTAQRQTPELALKPAEARKLRLTQLFANTRLTPAQRRLARYVVECGTEVAFLSSTSLAEEVGVSQPSVTRFAAALGFSGYAELQDAIREIVLADGGVDLDLSQNKMQLAIGRSRQDLLALQDRLTDLETITNAALRLSSSAALAVYGSRASEPLVRYFLYFARKIHPNVRAVNPLTSVALDELAQAKSDGLTTLLAIVVPRYPREALEVLAFARELGLSVILITDSATAAPAEHADLVLAAPVNPELVFDAPIASMQLVACLLEAIADSDSGRARKRLELLERVATERRTYVDG